MDSDCRKCRNRSHIPKSLELILNDPNCYEHHCTYKDGKLLQHTSVEISSMVETNEEIRAELFKKYLEEQVRY